MWPNTNPGKDERLLTAPVRPHIRSQAVFESFDGWPGILCDLPTAQDSESESLCVRAELFSVMYPGAYDAADQVRVIPPRTDSFKSTFYCSHPVQ